MVTITLEGFRMFSDRIVDFQFFIEFHRSGPAIIFSYSTITSMLVIHQKSSQSSQDLSRPHQDGQYYSGRIMDVF